MTKKLVCMIAMMALAAATTSTALSDELEKLAGKWTVQKTNSEGQKYTQTIEIKKNKFTFKIAEPDGKTRLYAEGEVKTEKLGPFSSIVFSNIKGGASASELEPVDDTYTSIYRLDDDGTWLMATNFDKDRNQKPSLDAYKK